MSEQNERELIDGALNVATQLAMSDSEGHKGLGQILAGLCAIIEKRTIEDALSRSSPEWPRGEIIVTLRHARTFITSREKMHPDGVKLYDELLATLEQT